MYNNPLYMFLRIVQFWPHLIHIHLLEGGLQDLEVLNVLVLQIGPQLNLLHLDGTWKIGVALMNLLRIKGKAR